MARPRKVSLSERIKQKRLSSRAPSSPDHGVVAPEALHVAPLPPLPAIEAPAAAAPVAPEPIVPEPVVVPEPIAAAPEPIVVPERVAPRRAAAPEPPPIGEMDDEARLELDSSLAPVASLDGSGRPGRGVALVAGIAVMLGVAIGIKISRSRAHRSPPPVTQPAAVATVREAPVPLPAPPPPPPIMSATVSAEPAASAAPITSASAAPATSASAAPITSASAAPATSANVAAAMSAEPAAAPSTSSSADAPSATSLRDHALDLLKRAKNPEAMAAASAALDADPTDAMPYLVLGSALQDTGRWKEAHRTYELCVKFATKGMLDECRAMLRRR